MSLICYIYNEETKLAVFIPCIPGLCDIYNGLS